MVCGGAVHGENFKTSVQALMLLQQMVGGQSQAPKQQGTQAEASGLEARFYRAVYDKLRAPEVSMHHLASLG